MARRAAMIRSAMNRRRHGSGRGDHMGTSTAAASAVSTGAAADGAGRGARRGAATATCFGSGAFSSGKKTAAIFCGIGTPASVAATALVKTRPSAAVPTKMGRRSHLPRRSRPAARRA
jgi:hypothetical protein